jgi:hypothetical protein
VNPFVLGNPDQLITAPPPAVRKALKAAKESEDHPSNLAPLSQLCRLPFCKP